MATPLHEILSQVAKGKLTPEEAEALLAKEKSQSHEVKEGFLNAFEKIKKNAHVEDLLKTASGLVQQISENMPNQLEKWQESVSHNINTLGFSAGTEGVEAKLSVFRTFHRGDGVLMEGNTVVGSQWFGVHFEGATLLRGNRFTAVQFSEVAVLSTEFSSSSLSLTRFSNVTLQDSHIQKNRFLRSTFSDVSLTSSEFYNVRLQKSEFAQTVFNNCTVSDCQFESTLLKECEFDTCTLASVTFENCQLEECTFENLVLSGSEPFLIKGVSARGLSVEGPLSALEFEKILREGTGELDVSSSSRHEADPSNSRAKAASPTARKRPPSDH
jgi:uncharacterized protein YjbI with pentapeptide repeats